MYLLYFILEQYILGAIVSTYFDRRLYTMMLKKTLKFCILLLVSNSLLCAELASTRLPSISLESILQNEPTKAFYTHLSQEKQQEFAAIIVDINTIFTQALSQLNTLVQTHKELIEEYQQTLSVKALNFTLELQPVIEN